jgi:hypothetical protein
VRSEDSSRKTHFLGAAKWELVTTKHFIIRSCSLERMVALYPREGPASQYLTTARKQKSFVKNQNRSSLWSVAIRNRIIFCRRITACTQDFIRAFLFQNFFIYPKPASKSVVPCLNRHFLLSFAWRILKFITKLPAKTEKMDVWYILTWFAKMNKKIFSPLIFHSLSLLILQNSQLNLLICWY